MSQDLQTSRYDQLVRRAGGLLGPGSKVSEVLSEVFPVLDLENTPAELLALTGWRTAWQSTERLSTAGNNSTSQLFNPAGSNTICTITQLVIRSDTVVDIQAEIVAAALAAGVRGLFRDARFGIPRQSVAVVSSLDGGAAGGGLRLRLVVDEQFTLRDDNGIVVLTPGSGLTVGTTTNAIRLTVNYFWRERLAQPSEINFPS